MVASFQHNDIQLIAACVDDHHFHLLAKFPDHRPRHWVGLAKSFSARALSDAGLVDPGGVWAIRCRCLPVRDRAHQVNIARYIAGHARHRNPAAVWMLNPETSPKPRG